MISGRGIRPRTQGTHLQKPSDSGPGGRFQKMGGAIDVDRFIGFPRPLGNDSDQVDDRVTSNHGGPDRFRFQHRTSNPFHFPARIWRASTQGTAADPCHPELPNDFPTDKSGSPGD